MSGALSGIRVLDLSRVLAGPWASQLLADYGAEVIKVERPASGDDTRHWGPPWLHAKDGTDTRESAYFLAANRNKRSVTVDISTDEGQAIVRRLAKKADVLLENFRVNTLQRYGLDAAALRKLNPRLIYCSISAYGQDGPRANEAGYDAMIQASAGLMSITGDADGPPIKAGVAVSDLMAGMYAASAILAALHARSSSGTGQHIDVPLFDTQVACLANQAMNFLISDSIPERHGNAHPNIVPYQSFTTADGYLMLAIGNDQQFADCVSCMGCAQLGTDPRFVTNADRVANREDLIPLLKARLLKRPTAHWLDVFSEHGVPCGPINDLQQVFDDPQTKARKLRVDLPHPVAGVAPSVINPVRFSETPSTMRTAPPLLGEHTDDILKTELGYTSAEINELRSSGTI